MFDIIGVIILIVFIVLFGFLTTRAWKLNNRFLKWAGVILMGLLMVIPALLLVLALIGYSKLNAQFENPLVAMQVAGTPEQITRGEKLANNCTSCHSPGNELPLAGSNFAEKFDFPPLGTLYAPNLTPAGNISDWSDGEIIRAIREGVHKDGRSLLIMPSYGYRYLSDEDVQALVAYLRSQPATGEPLPKTRFNLLGAVFMNIADFRTAQPPAGVVNAPEHGTAEYGQYMVNIIGCADCHGDQLQGRIESNQPGPPAGPNLTEIVPQWTEEEFMTFFNSGILPGGSEVPIITLPSGFSEPRMPWTTVRAVASDAELHDMYSYLHNLPGVAGPAD